MSDAYIRHIVPAPYFRALADSAPYLPREFGADGFIHCTCEPDVLLQVANHHYRSASGEFLVLIIDPAKVNVEIKFEPPNPPPLPGAPRADHLFPHIYGPLNRDAIVEVRPARRAPDGTFLEV
jgi:uncharacterized protein (DUF952 family)